VAIVFGFMGHPVGIGEALVIESLLHAVRGAAFAIPSALGAQEGALVVLCAAFGIPPEQAIALSLVKRAADLVLGVPGLLGWQMLEWGRLVPSYRRQPARESVNPRSQSHWAGHDLVLVVSCDVGARRGRLWVPDHGCDPRRPLCARPCARAPRGYACSHRSQAASRR